MFASKDKKVWLVLNVLMIAAMLSAFAAKPASVDGLAMFRGGLRHNGFYDTNGPTSAPQVLWAFQTGGKVVSSPAVYGSLLFFGSYDGNLYAVNKNNGKVHWQFQTGDQVKSSPAIKDGTVYFASKNGTFYALKASDGTLRWKFQTNDASTSYYEKDIPWFTEGIDPGLYAGTGETRFSQINDPWDFYYSSAAVEDGTVYFGAYDGNLYALDSASGALRWKFQTMGPVRSSPAVAYGTVYVGSLDGNLYALDARTGVEKWRSPSIAWEWSVPQVHSSPAVAYGAVFYGGRDSYLRSLNAATGAENWKAFHDGSWVVGSPAVAGGVVYEVSSDSQFIQAVDAATGAEKWRFFTGHNVFASPAITKDTLYVGEFNAYSFTDDSYFYALDIKDGSERWRFATKGSTSSPVVDDGVVYFGTDDGFLYALK